MDTGTSSSSVSSRETQSRCTLQEDAAPRHHPSHSYSAKRKKSKKKKTNRLDSSSREVALINRGNLQDASDRSTAQLDTDDEGIRVIEYGPHVPQKMVNGQSVPKKRQEFDESDEQLLQLNAMAMNYLYCALDSNVFTKIFTCESAKEIWDRLEVIYEGTSQVKMARINILERDYERFRMKPDETISEMFARFYDIISRLNSLGKVYSEADKVRKILRSLPKTWEPIVTIIEEVKDLNKLRLYELEGSLIVHEMRMKEHSEEEKVTRRIKVFATNVKNQGTWRQTAPS